MIDAVLLRPGDEDAAGELGTVVGAHHAPGLAADVVQGVSPAGGALSSAWILAASSRINASSSGR